MRAVTFHIPERKEEVPLLPHFMEHKKEYGHAAGVGALGALGAHVLTKAKTGLAIRHMTNSDSLVNKLSVGPLSQIRDKALPSLSASLLTGAALGAGVVGVKHYLKKRKERGSEMKTASVLEIEKGADSEPTAAQLAERKRLRRKGALIGAGSSLAATGATHGLMHRILKPAGMAPSEIVLGGKKGLALYHLGSVAQNALVGAGIGHLVAKHREKKQAKTASLAKLAYSTVPETFDWGSLYTNQSRGIGPIQVWEGPQLRPVKVTDEDRRDGAIAYARANRFGPGAESLISHYHDVALAREAIARIARF